MLHSTPLPHKQAQTFCCSVLIVMKEIIVYFARKERKAVYVDGKL